jgi:transcriptional regulator with XRE-family HTH domain
MDEIRRDYYDQLHEQNLTRHVGTTSKPRLPTERELQAQAQPVKIVVYPALQTLPERIKYLQGKETVVDFCKRAGISIKSYNNVLRGCGETHDKKFLARMARLLNCPEKWLLKGEQETVEETVPEITRQESPEPPHVPTPKLRMPPQLETLRERLEWLVGDNTVNHFCREMNITNSSFYNYRRTGVAKKEVMREIAEKCSVPYEWLVGDCIVDDTTMREKIIAHRNEKWSQGQTENAKPKATKQEMTFSICGKYEAEQIATLLAGFGHCILRVNIELEGASHDSCKDSL